MKRRPRGLSNSQLCTLRRAFSGRPDSDDPRLNYAVETIQRLIEYIDKLKADNRKARLK